MQTAVTVVNLIHDTATETDRPVCWVFPFCSWRECRSTSVPALTEAEYAKLEKTHLCCTAAAVSDNREPLLPHWHVEGS